MLFFLIFNNTNAQLFATMKHLKNLHNITKLHEENYKSTILKIAVDFFTANSITAVAVILCLAPAAN